MNKEVILILGFGAPVPSEERHWYAPALRILRIPAAFRPAYTGPTSTLTGRGNQSCGLRFFQLPQGRGIHDEEQSHGFLGEDVLGEGSLGDHRLEQRYDQTAGLSGPSEGDDVAEVVKPAEADLPLGSDRRRRPAAFPQGEPELSARGRREPAPNIEYGLDQT